MLSKNGPPALVVAVGSCLGSTPVFYPLEQGGQEDERSEERRPDPDDR